MAETCARLRAKRQASGTRFQVKGKAKGAGHRTGGVGGWVEGKDMLKPGAQGKG